MLLEVTDLHASYGHIHALKGISFHIEEGEIVTLIGSNGAGKSTSVDCMSGLMKYQGSIKFKGAELNKMSASHIVKLGLCMVPEGRQIFPDLRVEQNLEIGAYLSKNKAEIDACMQEQYELFPILKERKNQLAGTLSGGEQQMLAIARALMSKPTLLMLDEPSLGLAPILVQQMFDLIVKINKSGMTILLIEQNADMALRIANRAYVIEVGNIALEGDANELRNNPKVQQAYLGIA